MSPNKKDILLVEQSAMVGNIIVSTARQLDLPGIHLVTSIRSAQQQLQNQVYGSLIVALDEETPALQLIEELRQGGFRSSAALPVAITASACDASLAQRLRVLKVRRVLLKPFKIRDVVTTIDVLRDTVPA